MKARPRHSIKTRILCCLLLRFLRKSVLRNFLSLIIQLKQLKKAVKYERTTQVDALSRSAPTSFHCIRSLLILTLAGRSKYLENQKPLLATHTGIVGAIVTPSQTSRSTRTYTYTPHTYIQTQARTCEIKFTFSQSEM